MVYIYALCEPNDCRTIRYIGKTVDLRSRYAGHVSFAEHEAKLPKNRWVAKLLAAGKSPVLEVLELASEDTWVTAEQAWIRHGREVGWPLLNLHDGGTAGRKGTVAVGKVYGRLTVVSRSHLPRKFFCQCSCGSTIHTLSSSLAQSRTRSCGCLKHEVLMSRLAKTQAAARAAAQRRREKRLMHG